MFQLFLQFFCCFKKSVLPPNFILLWIDWQYNGSLASARSVLPVLSNKLQIQSNMLPIWPLVTKIYKRKFSRELIDRTMLDFGTEKPGCFLRG
ncbi:hypothetical protein AM228_02395 [Planktothricoides sp. SR001]|nr:hypothetical protein AM228_02395 [Planktothricoides sp. SR001]